MGFATDRTTGHLSPNSVVEYEDHPFQPSRISPSQATPLHEEPRPRPGCGRLRARVHGKERKFEREDMHIRTDKNRTITI